MRGKVHKGKCPEINYPWVEMTERGVILVVIHPRDELS